MENKEQSYRNYCGVNNLSGITMSQKLTLNGFMWVGETSQFNEDFIKSSNTEGDEGFLKGDIQYPEKLHNFYNDLPFLPVRTKV